LIGSGFAPEEQNVYSFECLLVYRSARSDMFVEIGSTSRSSGALTLYGRRL
jgi:hypothetical protein